LPVYLPNNCKKLNIIRCKCALKIILAPSHHQISNLTISTNKFKKIMKFILTTIFCLTAFFAFSQDLIVFKTGEETTAKVLEITNDEVLYKLTDNLEGPQRRANQKDILFVKYANGKKEMFTTEPIKDEVIKPKEEVIVSKTEVVTPPKTPKTTGTKKTNFEIGVFGDFPLSTYADKEAIDIYIGGAKKTVGFAAGFRTHGIPYHVTVGANVNYAKTPYSMLYTGYDGIDYYETTLEGAYSHFGLNAEPGFEFFLDPAQKNSIILTGIYALSIIKIKGDMAEVLDYLDNTKTSVGNQAGVGLTFCIQKKVNLGVRWMIGNNDFSVSKLSLLPESLQVHAGIQF
jgi:hypothetical protein